MFGRPIGKNQGVQFPIARAHVNVEAADLMRIKAAELFDRGEPCGAEANMAKLLAADASWEAANVAVQTHGGFGFAEEYDIERKFRETRLYQVAPVSSNLILAYVAEHVLGSAQIVLGITTGNTKRTKRHEGHEERFSTRIAPGVEALSRTQLGCNCAWTNPFLLRDLRVLRGLRVPNGDTQCCLRLKESPSSRSSRRWPRRSRRGSWPILARG